MVCIDLTALDLVVPSEGFCEGWLMPVRYDKSRALTLMLRKFYINCANVSVLQKRLKWPRSNMPPEYKEGVKTELKTY